MFHKGSQEIVEEACQDGKEKFQVLGQKFLQWTPLNSIKWEDYLPELNEEQQLELLTYTVYSKENTKFPISRQYQKFFFRKIIDYLEGGNSDINENLYTEYCNCVSSSPDDYAYKHYKLRDFDSFITLKENVKFVVAGTTGLCTWQASITLTEWCLKNRDIFQDKNVLELGAGTGLCGITVGKFCGAKEVIMTDGSMAVIDLLEHNIKVNDVDNVKSIQLPWDEVDDCRLPSDFIPDILLAADVVYDPSVFTDLMHAIKCLFKRNSNKSTLILGATVRNETTLNDFLELLASKSYVVREEHLDALINKSFVWDEKVPVKVYNINKDINSICNESFYAES